MKNEGIKHGINFDCKCNNEPYMCNECRELLDTHDDYCDLCNPSIAELEKIEEEK
jgi:hypothetical protein|tara:strand:+ start:811 stop:975 length:165 start_codon:yes stop_codon:yes gene_type:complete